MATHSDVLIGLKKRLSDANPTFRVEWPNLSPDTFTVPYVSINVQPIESTDETMGSTSEIMTGFVSFLVVIPKDTSTESIGVIMDFLKSVFYRGLRFSYGTTNITLKSHINVRGSYPDGVFYNTPADLTYEAS